MLIIARSFTPGPISLVDWHWKAGNAPDGAGEDRLDCGEDVVIHEAGPGGALRRLQHSRKLPVVLADPWMQESGE